jgi:hypothetical protein
VDCAKRGKQDATHQFHIRCSQVDGKGSQYVGDEAEHFNTLLEQGLVNNSAQAKAWSQENDQLALVRGVEPAASCGTCKAAIPLNKDGTDYLSECPSCHHRNGLPELRMETPATQRKRFARDLAGGDAAVRQREIAQRREETERLKEAAGDIGREIAAAIKEALAK